MLGRLRADEGGFSLIEMVMVCAMLGLVLGGVTSVFIAGSHASLNLNARFSAQQSARIALAKFRTDAHSACSANVAADGKSVILAIPITNTAVNPPVTPDPTQVCGKTAGSNLKLVTWCVLTSPTATGQFALYRAVASTCTSVNGTLIADNFVNTASGFAGYFTWPGSIRYGEMQVVDVDFSAQIPSSGVGVGLPYRLQQRVALRDTVWPTTAGTACSVSVPCNFGTCTVGAGCAPAVN